MPPLHFSSNFKHSWTQGILDSLVSSGLSLAENAESDYHLAMTPTTNLYLANIFCLENVASLSTAGYIKCTLDIFLSQKKTL